MSGDITPVAQIGKWHLDLKREGGSTNRVATTFKPGNGYEIESQLEWMEQYEGESVPEAEQALIVSVGRFTGVETVPLGVLEWLMRGVVPAPKSKWDGLSRAELIGRLEAAEQDAKQLTEQSQMWQRVAGE